MPQPRWGAPSRMRRRPWTTPCRRGRSHSRTSRTCPPTSRTASWTRRRTWRTSSVSSRTERGRGRGRSGRDIRTPVAFSLNAEQHRLIEEARLVAREHLVPLVDQGHPGRVNRPLVKGLGQHWLLPRLFPQRAGGTADRDVSALDLCLLREALAQESTEAETALAMQGLGGYTILQSGTDDLVQQWVPAIARGEAVAAFALTEPNAGTDAAALELLAEPDGDGYRLTGVKTWISNSPDADVYAIFARTTPGARSKGVTAFVLPG